MLNLYIILVRILVWWIDTQLKAGIQLITPNRGTSLRDLLLYSKLAALLSQI